MVIICCVFFQFQKLIDILLILFFSFKKNFTTARIGLKNRYVQGSLCRLGVKFCTRKQHDAPNMSKIDSTHFFTFLGRRIPVRFTELLEKNELAVLLYNGHLKFRPGTQKRKESRTNVSLFY